jgi:hypothetical protein
MADDSRNTLRLAIATGVLAVLGTVAAGAVKGIVDVQLAKRKLSSDLLMLALQSGSPQERLQSLQFMVETQLISEKSIADGLDQYVKTHRANPSLIPQFKQVTGSEPLPPVVENARIFLLAGWKDAARQFPELRSALVKAGFKVLGDELLIGDPSRPDYPEIRFFNSEDARQAEQLAVFMRARLRNNAVVAKQYDDQSAKPGYVEVWIGKK